MGRAVKEDTFSVATTSVAVSSTLNGVSLADFTDPVQQAFECAIATAVRQTAALWPSPMSLLQQQLLRLPARWSLLQWY
jgi:hypothetical protein